MLSSKVIIDYIALTVAMQAPINVKYMSMEIVITIDSRGHIAPLPLIELKKALDGAACGQGVEIISDDKMIAADLERYALAAGHEVASRTEDDGVMRFVMIRGE